ncbi:MAG: hypothetical protein GY754_42645 [bacterium]|nr:hypothetical protein [bacterium]
MEKELFINMPTVEELMAIPENRVKKIHNIPVNVYIQEAENLYHWYLLDREELESNGLDPAIPAELPGRNRALLEAEARWVICRNSKTGDRKRWADESPAAYKFRANLQRQFRFAYREIPERLRHVREIGKRSGHAGMLQALNDLAVLGRAHPGPLEAIKMDMGLVEEAARLSQDLSVVLANASTETMNLKNIKDVRDRAYSYLKEAVDIIRNTGQFVFRDNKEKKKKYASPYLHKKNARYGNKKIPGKKAR